MPYRTGLIYRDSVPVEYDGGDYPAMLEKAIERADYQTWRKRQRETSNSMRKIGIGISSYVEGGGIRPREGSLVKVDDTGRVTVCVGVNSQGQSLETRRRLHKSAPSTSVRAWRMWRSSAVTPEH